MNTGTQFTALAICCLCSLSLTIAAQAPGTGARRGAVFGPDGRALPNVRLIFDDESADFQRFHRFLSQPVPKVKISSTADRESFLAVIGAILILQWNVAFQSQSRKAFKCARSSGR
jgi:hypothetical protein